MPRSNAIIRADRKVQVDKRTSRNNKTSWTLAKASQFPYPFHCDPCTRPEQSPTHLERELEVFGSPCEQAGVVSAQLEEEGPLNGKQTSGVSRGPGDPRYAGSEVGEIPRHTSGIQAAATPATSRRHAEARRFQRQPKSLRPASTGFVQNATQYLEDRRSCIVVWQ